MALMKVGRELTVVAAYGRDTFRGLEATENYLRFELDVSTVRR